MGKLKGRRLIVGPELSLLFYKTILINYNFYITILIFIILMFLHVLAAAAFA